MIPSSVSLHTSSVASLSAITTIQMIMSVGDLEGRTIFRPRATMIVDARGADVGVAKPFLHLGDVGLVVERIGRSRRAQRMCADLEPELCRVGPHQLVDAIGGDRLSEPPGAVVADRPEQRAGLVAGVPGRL